jgi:hypothetical protein
MITDQHYVTHVRTVLQENKSKVDGSVEVLFVLAKARGSWARRCLFLGL